MATILPEAMEAALEAIQHGRTDILKALIDQVKSQTDLSAFLNQFLSNGKTLLEIAVEKDQVDIARALLREGADPSLKDANDDDDSKSIYQKATSERMKDVFACEFLQTVAQSDPDLKIIKRFLNGGLCYASTLDDPKLRNNALHWAASFACKEIVEFLIESNHKFVDNANFEGITPLHEAALRGDPDIINVILKAGADPSIPVREGKWRGKAARDLLREDLKYLIPEETTPDANKEVEFTLTCSEEPTATTTDVLPASEAKKSLPSISNTITDERLKLLWPPPQSILEVRGDYLPIQSKITLTILSDGLSIHEILDIVDQYKGIMHEQTKRCIVLSNDSQPVAHLGLQIVINQRLFHIKGAYKFVVSSKGMRLITGDREGIQYGLTTFIQLMRLFRVPDNENDILLKPMIINDYPNTSIRGVLLDLNSYGRIPHFKILLSMIDIWSFMKANHFHVYIRLHRTKEWQLPYSKINLLSIDRYCRQRAIQFVPALDIGSDVKSMDDAREMVQIFSEVISCFDSTQFLHLGPELSSLISKSHELYNTIIPPIKKKNMTLILCSNSILPNCSYIPCDSLFLYYSFETCVTDFRMNVESFYSQGYNFALCSGTNAWSSIAGSPDKMKENLFHIQKINQGFNGVGSINAHWSSVPSFNHLVFAWPGYILSSGLGWNQRLSNDENISSLLEDVLGYYIVDGKSEAKALLELGRIEGSFMTKDMMSEIFKLLTHETPEFPFLLDRCVEDYSEVIQNIRRVQTKLLQSKSPNKTAREIYDPDERLEEEMKLKGGSSSQIRALWSREVYLSSELILIGARVGRALVASKTLGFIRWEYLRPTFKTDIANRLMNIMNLYKIVWTSGHGISGLEESLEVLNKLFLKLLPS